MKKELAVQLKQAGFPQVFTEAKCYYDTQEKSETTYFVPYYGIDNETRYAVVPTLEELIEACKKTHESNGYTFDFVINYVNSEEPYWFAGYEYMDGWCEGEDGQGATPAEAVANLWLSLNKELK